MIQKVGGIYIIRNKITGDIYVGCAALMGFKKRWTVHRSNLRGGYHSNKSLLADWNNYGEENFAFEIIQVLEDFTDMVKIEDKWIRTFGRDNTYNYRDFLRVQRRLQAKRVVSYEAIKQ